MHLGRNRARHGTSRTILRPYGSAIGLAHMLHDGEALPDGRLTIDQDRHLAGRRVLEHLLLGIRQIEWNNDLVEGDTEMLHQQPGAQGPGRVALVGDDEGWHYVSLFPSPVWERGQG